MRKTHLFPLILSVLLLGACKEPTAPIPDLWPPEMSGWTIEKVSDLPVPVHNEILFFDEADALVYQEGVWFSEDGGKTWEERSPQSGIIVDAVSFQNLNEGLIAYHTGDGNDEAFAIYFAQTLDAGQNWTINLVPGFKAPVYDLWMQNKFDGLVAGFDGTIALFQTYDSGASWEKVQGVIPKFPTSTLRSDNQLLYFRDDTYGYVLGEEGEGWYTTADGGTSWGYQELDVFRVRSYQVLGPDTVYFNAERLYRSVTGGTDASFVGQEILENFIAGEKGEILGMERVSEDLSNLSAPIYYFRLIWQDGQGGTTKSQSMANHYFSDFAKVGPSLFFALSSKIRETDNALYRLQKN